MTATHNNNAYALASLGSFKAIRHWPELDIFWQHLETLNDGDWFIYDTDQEPPDRPATSLDFSMFIKTLDALLHEKHREDYCGIVYVDNLDKPRYIKIYDPANLGVVCGYSDKPPLPGWILSKLTPCNLQPEEPLSFWKKCLQRFN